MATPIVITQKDKAWIRRVLAGNYKVAMKKGQWRRGRDTAKHLWPKDANGRTI